MPTGLSALSMGSVVAVTVRLSEPTIPESRPAPDDGAAAHGLAEEEAVVEHDPD